MRVSGKGLTLPPSALPGERKALFVEEWSSTVRYRDQVTLSCEDGCHYHVYAPRDVELEETELVVLEATDRKCVCPVSLNAELNNGEHSHTMWELVTK